MQEETLPTVIQTASAVIKQGNAGKNIVSVTNIEGEKEEKKVEQQKTSSTTKTVSNSTTQQEMMTQKTSQVMTQQKKEETITSKVEEKSASTVNETVVEGQKFNIAKPLKRTSHHSSKENLSIRSRHASNDIKKRSTSR